MDLWAVHHVKNTTRTPVFLRNSFSEKPNSWHLGKPNSCSGADCKGKVFEIRVLRRRRISTSSSSSFAVRAMAKKNHENSGNGDRSIPEGDGKKKRTILLMETNPMTLLPINLSVQAWTGESSEQTYLLGSRRKR